MSVKPIISDPVFLVQPAQTATPSDLLLAIDLRDTLIAHKRDAAGLAANMIGGQKQIIACYIGMLPIIMLNPRLTFKQDQYQIAEGCLSLEGERQAVRCREIVVSYQDLKWIPHAKKLSGFVAEVVQHELDHCHGILI